MKNLYVAVCQEKDQLEDQLRKEYEDKLKEDINKVNILPIPEWVKIRMSQTDKAVPTIYSSILLKQTINFPKYFGVSSLTLIHCNLDKV